MRMKKQLEKIIDHFGTAHQTIKAIEELCELSVALTKLYNSNSGNYKECLVDVKKELSDVLNMSDQIKLMYKIDDKEINEIRESKNKRIIDKIYGKNI